MASIRGESDSREVRIKSSTSSREQSRRRLELWRPDRDSSSTSGDWCELGELPRHSVLQQCTHLPSESGISPKWLLHSESVSGARLVQYDRTSSFHIQCKPSRQ